MRRFITYPLSFGITIISGYCLFTWIQLSAIPHGQISASDCTPQTFRISRSITTIINPNTYLANHNSRSVILHVPKDLSDEVLLARFVKGFFGGYVFAPEGAVLRAMKKDMVKYSSLQNTPVTSYIWHHSSLSTTTPPQMHSMLFGAFRVNDRRVGGSVPSGVFHSESSSTEDYGASHSYIDFAFGTEGGRLAGMHRFSILRHSADEQGKVTIEFSDTAFDPRAKRPLKPELLVSFHRAYAMLLFRDGVKRVMNG